MSQQFIPYLTLSSTYNNSVATNVLSGTISNAISQVGATTNVFGTSSFASGATFNLAETNAFPSPATIDFGNAEVSGIFLSAANSNAVETGTLTGSITNAIVQTTGTNTLSNTSFTASATLTLAGTNR
jgi:hypothetical protein